MITAEYLRQRLYPENGPFQPFRIHLTDGRQFDILDPAWNLVLEVEMRVGIAPADELHPRVPDHHEGVPLKLIHHLEPLVASVAQGGGGAA